MWQPPTDPGRQARRAAQAQADREKKLLAEVDRKLQQQQAQRRGMDMAGGQIEFAREMQQRSETYTQIVCALGYGGLFTLWNGLSGRLPLWLLCLTGLLLGV